jgi:hypothetical protein
MAKYTPEGPPPKHTIFMITSPFYVVFECEYNAFILYIKCFWRDGQGQPQGSVDLLRWIKK